VTVTRVSQSSLRSVSCERSLETRLTQSPLLFEWFNALSLHKSHLHTGVILQKMHTHSSTHTARWVNSMQSLLCQWQWLVCHSLCVKMTECPFFWRLFKCALSHPHTVTIVSVTVTRVSQSSTQCLLWAFYATQDSTAISTQWLLLRSLLIAATPQCLLWALSATQDSLTQESSFRECILILRWLSHLLTVHTESCPCSDYCVSDNDACVTVIPSQCLVCASCATQDSLTHKSLSLNCVEMTVTHEGACYLIDDVSWVQSWFVRTCLSNTISIF